MKPHLGFNGVGFLNRKGKTLRIHDKRRRVDNPVLYQGPSDCDSINTWIRNNAIRPMGSRYLIRRGSFLFRNMKIDADKPLRLVRVRVVMEKMEINVFHKGIGIDISLTEGSQLKTIVVRRVVDSLA